ncbi:MAG TPA: hypothetical protein VEQ38_06900 [Verrucomicrobiae bacterium]|nr:hypothetical protein [Verrucomicrobiae bacterium]
MNMLGAKLLLTPTLIGVASILGRKQGVATAGWFVGLPLTSAPVTLFLALEHGATFASRAANGTLVGLVSLAGFCLVYGWAAFRLTWLPTMLLGCLAFFLATFLLRNVSIGLLPVFLSVIIALATTYALMPVAKDVATAVHLHAWEIPLRMISATAVVLLLTSVANILGPHLSGLLTPFPVFAMILAGFTHRFHGPNTTARLLRGILLGSFSFAVFFLTVASVLECVSIVAAFACATAITITLHGASSLLLRSI